VAAIVAAALSPSVNAMAATTVNDFYLRYVRPDADQAEQMRVSRRATIGWGIVQLVIAIGAQWMDRSVLDAGLAVLSFASGAVLGAFLLGTLMPAVRERDALVGMAAGLATMTVVWAWTPVAFTWYVFIGASTTCLSAWLLTFTSGARTAFSTTR
jgi:SSS family solute:Na+ symporter